MIASCTLMAIGLLLLFGAIPAVGAGHPALWRGLWNFLGRPRHSAAGACSGRCVFRA